MISPSIAGYDSLPCRWTLDRAKRAASSPEIAMELFVEVTDTRVSLRDPLAESKLIVHLHKVLRQPRPGRKIIDDSIIGAFDTLSMSVETAMCATKLGASRPDFSSEDETSL